MANSNFVVHNGLTVGPLTIDAATGNISTTGVIAVTGGGSFGGLNAYQIYSGSSNVTATTSYVNVSVNGSNVASFSSAYQSVTGYLNVSGNVLGAAATFNSATVNGALTATGLTTTAGVNSSANILATGGILSSLTVNGTLASTGLATLAGINSSANILATGGILSSLTVNGNITVTTAYVMPSANAASSLGSSATRWNFIYGVNGNFLSVNANYADLAEKYVADADYAPGTVLMFGGDKEVTQCVHDMCSRVAGVVSTNPAYLMNSGLEGEHTVELALTGRVPTRVRGPILKGDLIVSAGDGHARAEGLPQVGTVIGKALEDFDGDSGVIEVVVGKH